MKELEMNVTNETVRQFLQADYGEWLGLYSDGSIAIGQDVGNEISKAERPIACIQCPGFGNLSISDFVHSYAGEYKWDGVDWDYDLNRWVVEGKVLDDYEIIAHICATEDISWEVSDIKKRLKEDLDD